MDSHVTLPDISYVLLAQSSLLLQLSLDLGVTKVINRGIPSPTNLISIGDLHVLGWHCPHVTPPPAVDHIRYGKDCEIPQLYRDWATAWLQAASALPQHSRTEVHRWFRRHEVREPFPAARRPGIRSQGLGYPLQPSEWESPIILFHDDEAQALNAELDEEAEHHAVEAQELAHAQSNDAKVARFIQQGFSQHATSTLYFHTCLLSHSDLCVHVHSSTHSVGHVKKLVVLKKVMYAFPHCVSF